MKKLVLISFLLTGIFSFGQENVNYKKPPQEILDLVDIQRAPSVLLNDQKDFMVLLFRDQYKSIKDLSKDEMRLAGLRIDPKTNIGSRVTFYSDVQLKNLSNDESNQIQVTGLPKNPLLSNFSWSPDQTKIAMTNTVEDGVELWVLDLKTSSVKKLTGPKINANLGNVINWFEDGKSLLVKMVHSVKPY